MCALMSRSRAPSVRVRFLADAWADDAAMREEVEALLASHDDAGDVFERQPPADSALVRASIAPAPTHLAAGQRLGPFEIVETVGAGGCRRAGSGEAGSDSARSQPLPLTQSRARTMPTTSPTAWTFSRQTTARSSPRPATRSARRTSST